MLLTIGFAATVPGTGYLVKAAGWRTGWNTCAILLLAGMTPLALLHGAVTAAPSPADIATERAVVDKYCVG